MKASVKVLASTFRGLKQKREGSDTAVMTFGCAMHGVGKREIKFFTISVLNTPQYHNISPSILSWRTPLINSIYIYIKKCWTSDGRSIASPDYSKVRYLAHRRSVWTIPVPIDGDLAHCKPSPGACKFSNPGTQRTDHKVGTCTVADPILGCFYY